MPATGRSGGLCGIEYLYRVGTKRIYYVMDIDRKLGPVAIIWDVAIPAIAAKM